MNPYIFHNDILDLVDEAIRSTTTDQKSVGRSVPVSVWAGFSDLGSTNGRELLADLKQAGADRIVFTPTNDAMSSRWKWQPSRDQIKQGLISAKELGFKVELGPWTRCDPDFMDQVGREVRSLADDVGGVNGFELDVEGSFEITAKNRAYKYKNGIEGAVDHAISAFRKHVQSTESVSATVLYFERPAGSYLLKSKTANIRRAVIQAYSVWLKKPATQKPNFQPGILQERAWSNYEKFKTQNDIDELDIGLGWFAQDRSRAPAVLKISKPVAFRRASRACVELGCDSVSGWACHLFDGDSKLERARRSLVLNEIRYLTSFKAPQV